MPNNQIILGDGRRLGYAEYGDDLGQPFMYFHGWPSSRLEGRLVDAAARRYHLRFIAPDRPGFGFSDYQPGRKLTDWPSDVIELADALELDRFSVVGVSGGGPYAAVCALKIPIRLQAVGIISGSGPIDLPGVFESMRPLNRLLLQIGRTAPWLFNLVSWPTVRALRHNPDDYFHQQLGDMPEPDQVVMARTDIRGCLLDAALEAFRQGPRGAALENGIYARSWGFELQDITLKVHLWHGELDINTPPTMGRYLAATIPNCRSRFYENEGHISLFVNHMDEIFRTLTSDSANKNI